MTPSSPLPVLKPCLNLAASFLCRVRTSVRGDGGNAVGYEAEDVVG